jgi:hypothetical protein
MSKEKITAASTRREVIRSKIHARTVFEDAPAGLGLAKPCRLWTGPTSGDGRGSGYGRMNLDGATVAVHIAAWTNENGLIPPRKQLDHKCRRRLCAEETHLELVTHKQNQKRRDEARRMLCEAAETYAEACA